MEKHSPTKRVAHPKSKRHSLLPRFFGSSPVKSSPVKAVSVANSPAKVAAKVTVAKTILVSEMEFVFDLSMRHGVCLLMLLDDGSFLCMSVCMSVCLSVCLHVFIFHFCMHARMFVSLSVWMEGCRINRSRSPGLSCEVECKMYIELSFYIPVSSTEPYAQAASTSTVASPVSKQNVASSSSVAKVSLQLYF
jgi:hypothetical protein